MKKIILAAAIAATGVLMSCKGDGARPSLKTDVDTLSYELGMANSQGIDAYLAQQGLDSADMNNFLRGVRDGVMKAGNKHQRAYYLGLQSGLAMYENMIVPSSQQLFGGDSTQTLSAKNLVAGLVAGTRNKTALKIRGKKVDAAFAMQDVNERIQTLTAKSLEKKYGPQKAASDKAMQAKVKQLGLKPLGKGVYYKEVKAGDGQKPRPTDRVQVEYVLKLFDGKVVEDSKKVGGGKPVTIAVSGTIPGWQQALTQMPVGAEWEIYIPYDQAYGAQGAGPDIQPFTNLVFQLKLIGVEAPAAKPAASAATPEPETQAH